MIRRSRARRAFAIACVLALGLMVIGAIDLGWTWWSHRARVRALTHEAPGLTAYMHREGVTAPLPWRPLATIPVLVRCAIVAAEDPRFPVHRGIDWGRLRLQAAALAHGDFSGGYSGIAQQLARNLYLHPGRTPRRKLRELVLAHALVQTLSTDRLLEVYLNVIHVAPEGWGVEQGSLRLFGDSLEHLRPSEAVLLAAVLPAPSRGLGFALAGGRVRHVERIVDELWRGGHLDGATASATSARLVRIGALVTSGEGVAGAVRQVAEEMGAEGHRISPLPPSVGCDPRQRNLD